jgi:hypothetical protein
LSVKFKHLEIPKTDNKNEKRNSQSLLFFGGREIEIEPFLASSVPDLGLDDFVLNRDSPGLELNPNSGLGVQAELVLSKPGQELTLPHRRVSDHHHLEHIINFLVIPILLVTLRVNTIHFLIHFPYPKNSHEELGVQNDMELTLLALRLVQKNALKIWS